MHCGDKKILHISDTPTVLYPAIKSLVASLNPEVIIHTGDLADDIKLEHNPHHMPAYDRAVGPFIKMMEQSPAGRVYIVPGNHDNREVINRHISRAGLLEEGQIITVENLKIGLAHSVKKLPAGTQFNLYGHNFKPPREFEEGVVYLNGIKSVNIILIPSDEVVKIPYPWATNHHRKMSDKHKLPGTI
nr:metallophosphoesterase [Desulforadius tongensis]